MNSGGWKYRLRRSFGDIQAELLARNETVARVEWDGEIDLKFGVPATPEEIIYDQNIQLDIDGLVIGRKIDGWMRFVDPSSDYYEGNLDESSEEEAEEEGDSEGDEEGSEEEVDEEGESSEDSEVP